MVNELATGSFLAEDGETIVDITGIEITAIASRKVVVVEDFGNEGSIEVYAKDALAAIDRAGLDPVRIAARELVDRISKWQRARPGPSGSVSVEIGELEPELGALKELL